MKSEICECGHEKEEHALKVVDPKDRRKCIKIYDGCKVCYPKCKKFKPKRMEVKKWKKKKQLKKK